jgi:hypothetical protein
MPDKERGIVLYNPLKLQAKFESIIGNCVSDPRNRELILWNAFPYSRESNPFLVVAEILDDSLGQTFKVLWLMNRLVFEN